MKWIGRFVGLVLLALVALIAWGWQSDMSLEELSPRYTNDASQFITLDNGLAVHARDTGNKDGETIVLIHGSSASLHTWEPWVARLKDDYRVVSMDLAGHGLTGPHPSHDYTMTGQAALVDEVLRKMNIADGYTIVGSSMGGFISWLHTLNYPDRVKRLAIIGSSGMPYDTKDDQPFIYRAMKMPGIRDLMRKVTPRIAVKDTMIKVYNGRPEVVTEEMVDRYWHMLLREGNREATGIRNQQQRDMTAYKRLPDLYQPTLVMWGEIDALVPATDATRFAEILPRPTLVIYPDLGHIPFEEDPDRTTADFKAFLSSNP